VLGPNLAWRSIFIVNLPIGILGTVLAHFFLDNTRRRTSPGPFDWGGAFIQIIVLLAFIMFVDPPPLSIGGVRGVEIQRWILATVTLLAGWVFYMVQKQVPEPLLDFSLFRIRTFWAANLANFLNFLAYSALLLLMPFYLQEVMSYSPRRAGQLMVLIPGTVFFVAFVSGWLADRIGNRWLTVAGTGVSSLALLAMGGAFGHGLSPDSSFGWIRISLCLIGVGSGLFQSPNNVAVMSSISPDKLGVASALIATIRNLGFVTGTGIAATFFSWKHAESGNFVLAFHHSLLIAGALAAGAMIASMTKPEENPESSS
jgi:MFS family permease